MDTKEHILEMLRAMSGVDAYDIAMALGASPRAVAKTMDELITDGDVLQHKDGTYEKSPAKE